MEIRPSGVVFTLTRVVLRPEYRRVDEADALTERLVSACRTKLRLIRDQIGMLGDVCDRFAGCRRWMGLRNSEVESISEAAGDALSIVSPPRLLIDSYGFGLSSYRLVAVAQMPSDHQGGILASWRRMASEFRRILEGRIEGSLLRGSMASHYFSEIYAFYELDMSLPEIVVRWSSEFEPSMVPSRDEVRSLLSPLKVSSPPPEPVLSFLPNPVYISRDGIFTFFHYDSEGKGKRRNVHLMRRKRRRIFRLAIDLSLGLKVFLENEDLWLMGAGNLWGALTGMVYLSPKVVLALMRGEGRKFLNIYQELMRVMDLMERFESYEGLFTFPFPTERHIQAFAHTVRLLGGTAPKNMVPLPLTELQVALLKIILMKEGLDEVVEEWEEGSLECLARFLCEYARLLLGGDLMELDSDPEGFVDMALKRVSKGGGGGGRCYRELLEHMKSRKGRRWGLTAKELSILLSETDLGLKNPYHTVYTNLRELEGEDLLVSSEERRGRLRKKGERTRKGLLVSTFRPNRGHALILHLERLMEDAIRRAREGMVERSCFGGS